jgi:phospholipase/carboxylesterase
MAHGTEDPVIRFAWAEASRRVLEANGWKVEWHAYRMEHSANQDELRKVGAFIARVLGP